MITLNFDAHPSSAIRSVFVNGDEVGYAPAAKHTGAITLFRHVSQVVMGEIKTLVEADATVTSCNQVPPEIQTKARVKQYVRSR